MVVGGVTGCQNGWKVTGPTPVRNAHYYLPVTHAWHTSSPRPDPRLHFALNCGAKSCPMVRVYSGRGQQLEGGLEGATVSYLQQEVSLKEGRLQLPQILEWYMTDFAPDLPALTQ
ncbi:hypothetical protein Pcinc_040913, partial [Petrolisthes cinctipes]